MSIMNTAVYGNVAYTKNLGGEGGDAWYQCAESASGV